MMILAITISRRWLKRLKSSLRRENLENSQNQGTNWIEWKRLRFLGKFTKIRSSYSLFKMNNYTHQSRQKRMSQASEVTLSLIMKKKKTSKELHPAQVVQGFKMMIQVLHQMMIMSNWIQRDLQKVVQKENIAKENQSLLKMVWPTKTIPTKNRTIESMIMRKMKKTILTLVFK